MTNFSRVQAGVPTGGQFASQSRTESTATLAADEPTAVDWGEVDVSTGSRTPWGTADSVEHPAPGIAFASTSSHGGIKLSPGRNREIPKPLRNSSGWYEEDCESQIVGMYHPEAFPHYLAGDRDAARTEFAKGVKDWYPDQYTAATGEQVAMQDSRVLRERAEKADRAAFRAAHADEFVSTGWGVDSNGDWVPDDYTVLGARMDATGETRDFLVPRSEAIANHRVRDDVVIDPSRHIDVTGIGYIGNPDPHPSGPAITGDGIGIDYDNLTDSQRGRAEAELGRRWRYRNDDGSETVETLGEHFARVGLTGKRSVAYGNKQGTSYVVEYPAGYIHEVSKATFDALGGVPNATTEMDRAGIAVRNAEARLERARRDFDVTKVRAEQANVDAARAAEKGIRQAEEAKQIPWAERQRLRKQALDDLLADRGVELG